MRELVRTRYRFGGTHERSAFTSNQSLQLLCVGVVECAVNEPFHQCLHCDPHTTGLMLIRKGSGDFVFDGKAFTAKEGDLIVYNQGIWHEERSEPSAPFLTAFVLFTALTLAGLPPGYLLPRAKLPLINVGEWYFGIDQRFTEIHNLMEERGSEADFVADHLLGALIGEVLMVANGTRVSDTRGRTSRQDLVAMVKGYIHDNYNQRITLADLGALSCTSPHHVCRTFRARTGTSPIDYLIRHRIEVAKQYLRTTNFKVATISELVGYRRETQFHNAFRMLVGVPPGKYRATYQDSEEMSGILAAPLENNE